MEGNTPVVNYFLKKFEKEIKKTNYFVINLKGKDSKLLIEERMFYFMLEENQMPEEMIKIGYGIELDNGGVAVDGKEHYKKYKLSDKGELAFFSDMFDKIEKYKDAYDCFVNSQVRRSLVDETASIMNFFQKNKIASVETVEQAPSKSRYNCK